MKGSWVQIQQTILTADQRAESVPDDTKQCSYIMRINGYLENETANIGDTVTILTLANRLVCGELVAIAPAYTHSFGPAVTELIEIGPAVKKELAEAKYE